MQYEFPHLPYKTQSLYKEPVKEKRNLIMALYILYNCL